MLNKLQFSVLQGSCTVKDGLCDSVWEKKQCETAMRRPSFVRFLLVMLHPIFRTNCTIILWSFQHHGKWCYEHYVTLLVSTCFACKPWPCFVKVCDGCVDHMYIYSPSIVCRLWYELWNPGCLNCLARGRFPWDHMNTEAMTWCSCDHEIIQMNPQI